MRKQYGAFTEASYYRNPGAKIGLKCTLHGEFSKERFMWSLQKLRSIHPFLNCTIQQDDQGRCTYCETEDAEIYTEYKEKKDDQDWLAFIERRNQVPFIMNREVPLEWGIFHNGTETDIVLQGSHILGDGLSYVNLLKDFMQIYCDKNENLPIREPRLIQGADDFPKESALEEEAKKKIDEINSYWETARRVHSQQEYERMYQMFHTYCGCGFIYHMIEEDTFEEFLAACRENNVKINTALILALVMAQDQVSQGVIIAVNNRPLISEVPSDSLGNYASAVSCDIRYDKEKSFWENAKEMTAEIQKSLNNIKDRLHVLQVFASLDPSVYEGIYFSRPEEAEWREKFSKLVQPIKDADSMCTSNIGNVKIQVKNPMYRITDLVLIGQTACTSNKSIGIATIENQCSISMWYRKSSLKRGDMEQLLERVEQILEKAVLSEETLERYYA